MPLAEARGLRGAAGAPTTPLRILHCPTTTGGHPQGLARAERRLGLRSVAVTFEQNVYAYHTDAVLRPRVNSTLGRLARRVWLLQRALAHFDVVHYNFGQTIMPYPLPRPRGAARLPQLALRCVEMRELVLLKRAGRGVVVTFQGDDARQGDYSRANFPISIAQAVDAGYYPPGSDEAKRRRIGWFARYADHVYALNPDLLHVLPARARFMGYAHIDPAALTPTPGAGAGGGPPVVLHAPTHRQVKGTAYLLEAAERLRAEGVPFELRLVEGLAHHEAMRAYARADLLVDQLLAGWYGGLALELMALGKPVIAYLREGDLGYLPAAMRAELPVISATPQTIYHVLREWLTTRRAELAELGRRSREYSLRWHDPLAIAARHKADYEAIFRRG